MDSKFEKIKKEVEKKLDCVAHGMDHILRVYDTSLKLAKSQNVDIEVLKAAALLHDIGGPKEMSDPTGKTDHAIVSAEMAGPILRNLDFSKDKIKHIQDCIVTHRYRTDNKPKTLEAKILFDADKLDALGAIGIARAFAWVGKNKAPIFMKVKNIKAYAKENLGGKINGRIQDKTKYSVQVDYETKKKFLKDKLYTKEGKKIATERTKYYEKFLEKLEKEASSNI